MSHFHIATVGRSFLAIFSGFATMAVLVAATTAVLTRFFPRLAGVEGTSRRGYLLLNFAYSLFFAAAGGYVTATIAKADPLRHALVLAIVILLLGAASALQSRDKHPVLYQVAVIGLTPVAALAGGLARMYQTGFRW